MDDNKCKLSREFETSSKNAFYGLMKEQELVDVTLVCDDDKQVKAHKVILSAGSQFFKRMFQNNPHQHPLVYLYGIHWADLEAALEFLYLGEASVLERNLKRFLDISEKLKIVGINNPKESRKAKTPDLVKSSKIYSKIKVPDKDLVEETTKEMRKLPELNKFKENHAVDKENLIDGEHASPPTAGYYTGYYTTSVQKPVAHVKEKSSQKESLDKLTKSFNRYEREKGGRSNVNYERNVKERFVVTSDQLNCEKCNYQAISKDDFRMHGMAYHSIF